jgi:hypothetical protein
MNDMSLSSLYRRMTARGASPEVDAADLAMAATGADMPAERREAVAATLARSPAHASLARMLRALQPESEALAEAVGTRRPSGHPLRGRETRLAAGARRVHVGNRGHGLRWVGAVAACFVFAFALNFRQGEAPTNWNDVAASATTATMPDRIFTTRDQIFAASDDAPRGARGGDALGDRLFQANFAIGG